MLGAGTSWLIVILLAVCLLGLTALPAIAFPTVAVRIDGGDATIREAVDTIMAEQLAARGMDHDMGGVVKRMRSRR